MAYNLRTGLMGVSDMNINVSLQDLNTANIPTGSFAPSRIVGTGDDPTLVSALIPTIGNSKIDVGTINPDRLSTGFSTIDPDLIPVITNDHLGVGSINPNRLGTLWGDLPTSLIPPIEAGMISSAAILTNDIESNTVQGLVVKTTSLQPVNTSMGIGTSAQTIGVGMATGNTVINSTCQVNITTRF